jgi:hypothetical protein
LILGSERTRPAPGIVSIKSRNASGAKTALWSQDPSKPYEVRLKGVASNAETYYLCSQAPRPDTGNWMALSGTPLLVSTDGPDTPDFDIRLAN